MAASGRATVTWISDNDGFWDVGANWSTGMAPQAGDDVVIDRPGAITVTVRAPTAAVGDLTSAELLKVDSSLSVDGDAFLNGGLQLNGVLTGIGTFHLGSNGHWTAGSVSGVKLVVDQDQTLTIDTASNHDVFAGTLENHGTVLWTAGAVRLLFGSAIVNAAGGLWDVQGDLTMVGHVDPTFFTNAGVLRRSAGTGTFVIGFSNQLTNTGTIEVETGTFVVQSGWTNSGLLSVSTGATLDLGGATLQAGTTFSGGGTLTMPSTTVVSGSVTVTLSTILTGTLSGPGTLHLGAPMQWSGGTVSGVTLVVDAGQTLTIDTASNHDLVAATLENHGTVLWTAGAVRVRLGSAIVNAAGGLWDVQGDLVMEGHIDPTFFTNAGMLRRSAGTGTFVIGFSNRLTNTGTIEVKTGTFVVQSGLTNSGLLSVSTGAMVDLGGATLQAGSTFSGGGTLTMPSTTVVSGSVTVTLSTILTGTLSGPGTLHLGAPMQWSGGTVSGVTLVVDAGQTLTIDTASDHDLFAGTLENHGTVRWTAGALRIRLGSTIVNAADGIWEMQGDLMMVGHIDPTFFTNNGRITRSGAAGTLTINSPIAFTNSGVIEFRVGGTSAGQFDRIAAGSVALAGTVEMTPVNGFLPGPGDFFDVMSYGTRTGKFSSQVDGNGHAYTVAHYIAGVRVHAAFTNLVRNGTFADGMTHWQTFALPSPTDLTASVNNGVLEFFRSAPPPGVQGQATVFQETEASIALGAPLTAAFDLGNSSSVRKRITVLILDSDFSDLSVCTFWIPANAPLQTYQMQTHTTRVWNNAAIYFYAASAGSNGGFYRADNVSLQYTPGLPTEQTECLDPNAPPPTSDPPGPNLIVNGDFASGVVAPWILFGQIVSQIVNGVFEFYRPSGTPAGVILQPTNEAMTANQIMTATFDLGNSSAVRKRVTVIMHDFDFSDLSACTFWLEPGQPLSPYVMRTYAAKAWANATLSVYPATVGVDQWIRLDNATLRRTPGTAITGTECVEPGAASLLPQAERVAGVMALGPMPLAVPAAGVVDLTHAGRARVQFAAGLALPGGWVDVQVRTAGHEWITIGTTRLDDVTTWLEIDLAPFLGEIVEMRFVLHGVDEALVVDWRPTFTIDVRRAGLQPGGV